MSKQKEGKEKRNMKKIAEKSLKEKRAQKVAQKTKKDQSGIE